MVFGLALILVTFILLVVVHVSINETLFLLFLKVSEL